MAEKKLNYTAEEINEILRQVAEGAINIPITITAIEGGHRVTINGHTVDIMDGQSGEDGMDGNDGVSPMVEITPIEGGNRIKITDANGEQVVDVMDGEKGADGQPGRDGIDGTSVTHSWSGTTLTVTSASGTSSANLKGEKGDDGTPGATGSPGSNGKDGVDGVGVQSVVQTTTSSADGGENVVTVTLTDGSTSTFKVKNGSKGSAGEAGANGKDGSDASVTAENIKSALGYTPADAEEVGQLQEEIVDYIVPDYVKAEAEEVADKVLAARSADSFVMVMVSDFHTNGNDVSAVGVKHAGQGVNEINSLTQLDLVTLLGDYEVYDLDGGDSDTDGEDAKQSFKTVKKAFYEVGKSTPLMWLQGNHDRLDTGTTEEEKRLYYAFIGANNVGVVTDYENKYRNYGYRDFENYKTRVIYLNSVDVVGGDITDSCYMSAEQFDWLVSTALNMTVEGWGVVVLTHHPLNWEGKMTNLQNVLNAFKGKANGSVTVGSTAISYDFSNVKAEFIAHFHGHIHNFRSAVYGSNGILSISIPNACFHRNNEYGTTSSYSDAIREAYGDTDENGNQRQFNKTSGTAEDTAFNVCVIDRALKKIHLFCYGAGIDRELVYGEAEGGSEEILSVTWNEDSRLSTSDGGLRTGAPGYTASEKIDLSILDDVGDTLTVTGLSFDGSAYASRSIAYFVNSTFSTSVYPSTTTTIPLDGAGVTVKPLDEAMTTLVFERTGNSDGKKYEVAICGYGSGANAVVTLTNK